MVPYVELMLNEGSSATMNRMEHTIDNLTNIVMNTKQTGIRKLDADMAAESIELSKSRILQQAATSMLAQAKKACSRFLGFFNKVSVMTLRKRFQEHIVTQVREFKFS